MKLQAIKERGVAINIKRDHFASEYFGKEVHILNIIIQKNYFQNNSEITKITIDLLHKFNKSIYIISKHDLSDIPVIHGLEETGFKMMCVDVTFHINPDVVPSNACSNGIEVIIEEYKSRYINAFESLIETVQQFFYDTHYYNSPYFDKQLCDLFYRKWVLNNINGRSNRNYLAICENRIVGFILCIEKDNECVIDLIWVDKNMRGRGIGRLMIYKLFNNVKNKVVKVGTQIRSTGAVNLYLGMGFKVNRIYAIYHKYGRQ